MAFVNIDSALNLGNLLQTIFTKGMLLQLNRQSRDWEFFKKFQVGADPARDLKFMMQTSLGHGRVQSRSPGTAAFPASKSITSSEATARFKEFDVTTEISYNLWARAMESMAKYADPLAKELEASMIVTNRWLGKLMHLDGTGVFGTLGSSAGTLGSDLVTFALSTGRGWAGLFDVGDIFVLKVAAGTASDLRIDTSVAPAYWEVVSASRSANTVTMRPLDANFAAHTSLSAITTQAASGSAFYRFGQTVIPNLTSISDYDTASDVIVGLEGHAANDGRTLNGVVRSGVIAGTRLDGSAANLSVDLLAELIDNLDIRNGEGIYDYSQALLSKEANRFMILGAESDRRFQVADDARRGSKKFTFIHGGYSVELVTSEFTRKDRVWMLPAGKIEGRNVLELHLSDAKPVRKGAGEDGFNLKPNSSGFDRAVVNYMEGYACMLCGHPSAVGCLENFTIA